MNYFVFSNYHLRKISAQIIECKIFDPNELNKYLTYSITENHLENVFRKQKNHITNCIGTNIGHAETKKHDEKIKYLFSISLFEDCFYQIQLLSYKYFKLHTDFMATQFNMKNFASIVRIINLKLIFCTI